MSLSSLLFLYNIYEKATDTMANVQTSIDNTIDTFYMNIYDRIYKPKINRERLRIATEKARKRVAEYHTRS